MSGQSVGAYLRAELSSPWALDFHIGLGEAEQRRCATVVGIDETWRRSIGALPGPRLGDVLRNPPETLDAAAVNSPAWRRAEIPALNGHGTAHAIARFYGGLACGGVLDGVRRLSPALLRSATSVQSSGVDVLLEQEVNWDWDSRSIAMASAWAAWAVRWDGAISSIGLASPMSPTGWPATTVPSPCSPRPAKPSVFPSSGHPPA